MSDLKLDSLRIQNFRAFSDLQIEQLGRVNLIVGKNNTGKTSLLEAIRLWADPRYIGDYLSLLAKAYPSSSDRPSREVLSQRHEVLRHLFFGRPKIDEGQISAIEIGGDQKAWVKYFESSPLWGDRQVQARMRIFAKGDAPFIGIGSGAFEISRDEYGVTQCASVDFWSRIDEPELQMGSRAPYSRCEVNYVSSSGIQRGDAAKLWDDVIRTNRKARVLEALRIFLDDLVDVNWIEQPDLKLHFSGSSVRRAPDDTSSRVPLVSTEEAEEAVPLSTYGEGVSRSMNILLALCTAEDGVLLIDEIENGLHHSAQRDVFNLIFQTARDLNVQVFATTHSYDALKAFEKVANEHEDEEGMLVQLRRRRVEPHDIAAVTANEEKLRDALHAHVDPR